MKKCLKFIFSIITLSGAAGALVSGSEAGALSSQSVVHQEFTLEESISITLSDPAISIQNLLPGQYSDSNIMGITISTNTLYGYTLTATTGNDTFRNTNLTNLLDNSGTASAIFTSLGTSASVANLSSFSDNTWGYSYSTDNQATWSNYSGLPLYSDVASPSLNIDPAVLKDTTDPSDTDEVFFKIGARASVDKPSGRYENVITFTATAKPRPEPECEVGYICYNGNGAEENFGGMDRQAAAEGATVTLRAPNYKRANYGFLGWSTSTAPEIGSSTTPIYGPMEDIVVPAAASGKGLNLYAIWLPSSGYIQDFGATQCNTLVAASVTYDNTVEPNNAKFTVTANTFKALTDRRDGNTYTIARLTDGNCWMLENLRLGNLRLDEEPVTAEDMAAYSQNGVAGSFTTLPPSDSDLSNSWSGTASTNGNPYISGATAFTIPRYMSDNTTDPVRDFTGANSENNYAYGNYYTWNAARATTAALNSGNTTTSICPTNWRLPIGGSSTANYSFGALSVSMGGTNATMNSTTPPTEADGTPTGGVMSARIRQFPNNVLYSGYRARSSVNYRGTYGYYWSSTAYASNSAYYQYLSSSRVYPGTGSSAKYGGYSVRCVLGS